MTNLRTGKELVLCLNNEPMFPAGQVSCSVSQVGGTNCWLLSSHGPEFRNRISSARCQKTDKILISGTHSRRPWALPVCAQLSEVRLNNGLGRKRIKVEASAICGLPMEDTRLSRGSKTHVGLRKTWVSFYCLWLPCTGYKMHWHLIKYQLCLCLLVCVSGGCLHMCVGMLTCKGV